MRNTQQDIVRQAIAIFQKLQSRRAELQAELTEIDKALAQFNNNPPAAVSSAPAKPFAGRRGNTGGNAMPLREAVLQALKSGPKDRHEILKAVQGIGYQFNSTNPLNSLQTFLYGSGKSLVKRVDGKFALASGSSAAPKAQGNAAAVPAKKAKRVMSAAARKKIAEAVRARWAKQKAAAKK